MVNRLGRFGNMLCKSNYDDGTPSDPFCDLFLFKFCFSLTEDLRLGLLSGPCY